MLQERKEQRNYLGKVNVEDSVKNTREFSQINLTVKLLFIISLKRLSKLKSISGFLIYYTEENPYLTIIFVGVMRDIFKLAVF